MDNRLAAFTRRPLVVASGGLYLAYCLIAPLGWFSEHYGAGRLATLRFTALFWPYPLLLALQHWVEPGMPGSFIVADVFGLVVVLGSVEYLESWSSSREGRERVLRRLLPILWFMPLLIVQVFFAMLAGVLGYPVGE
jgi:hypothetical protein